jgi:hypothetical protein
MCCCFVCLFVVFFFVFFFFFFFFVFFCLQRLEEANSVHDMDAESVAQQEQENARVAVDVAVSETAGRKTSSNSNAGNAENAVNSELKRDGFVLGGAANAVRMKSSFDAEAFFGTREPRWDVVLYYPHHVAPEESKEAIVKQQPQNSSLVRMTSALLSLGNTAHLNTERDNIIRRLRGVGLVVKKTKANQRIFVLIGATKEFLCTFAEKMELPVRLAEKYGGLWVPYVQAKHFMFAPSPLVSEARQFEPKDSKKFHEEGDIFSSSDRQRIIWHVLNNVCRLDFASLISRKVIKRVVCLHDDVESRALSKLWVKRKATTRQPLDLVHEYFGSSLAFFFAITASYTNWLIPLSVAGVLQFLLSFIAPADAQRMRVVYATFCVFWAILFGLYWRRKSNSLRFRWGLLGPDEGAPASTRAPDVDEQLPTFRGEPKQGVWYGESFVHLNESELLIADADKDSVPVSLYASNHGQVLRKVVSYFFSLLLVLGVTGVVLLSLLVQFWLQMAVPKVRVCGGIGFARGCACNCRSNLFGGGVLAQLV